MAVLLDGCLSQQHPPMIGSPRRRKRGVAMLVSRSADLLMPVGVGQACWRWMFVAVISCAGPAAAVVIHPDEDASVGLSTPPTEVLGRWGSTASAIAVAPNHIVTTRHQSGGVNTIVQFGGIDYRVAEVVDNGNVDLRVARITRLDGSPANLGEFADLYTLSNERTQTVVIGGFGRGRGTELVMGLAATPYGYSWAQRTNQILRWGQNRIKSTTRLNDSDATGFTSEILTADFDRPDATRSERKVPFEAIPTEFDSGGGWFLYHQDQWKLAGLTRGVEHGGERQSWYRNADTAAVDPDRLDAVRVSRYYQFILDHIPDPNVLLGDVNSDGTVNNLDITPFVQALTIGGSVSDADRESSFLEQVPGGNFAAADMTWDLLVDNLDLTPFVTTLASTTVPSANTLAVPEPQTMLLVVAGGVLTLTRRPGQRESDRA